MKHREKKEVSRREFLKVAAIGVGAAFVSCDGTKAVGDPVVETPKKIPVGVQLYSVRGEAQKDLPKVLKAIGEMGYKGVEFAGYYGWEEKPKELRKLLDDNGLKCCGTHTGLNTLRDDALKTTAELNSILGNPYLIAPSLRAETEQDWMDLAMIFNELAVKASELEMRVGYHAHAGDFKSLGESTPWEIFFDNTDKSVLMQIDIGNCLDGGGDPVKMLKKYAGRSATVHVKEHGGPEGAVIGQGVVPWEEVLETVEAVGETNWFIVEHETGTNPMESIKGCLEGLRKFGRGL
ncbi:sugar phosphate isomerase/epimerase family protein [Acidobacteriota bacterium]